MHDVEVPSALRKEISRPRRWWRDRDRLIAPILRWLYDVVTFPFAVAFLFYGRFDASYGMTWWRKFQLAYRMYRNTRRLQTGTSFRAHLAMAVKLLEIPPSTVGAVVECGCWIGGSTANLSLVCDIVGRDLIVYDSFEGLPPGEPNEKYASTPGALRGDLEIVRENVRRYGAVHRCQFRKGWFKETLPLHREPIVLCFADVDLQASIYQCVVHLWPHLTERGYFFIDEYVLIDYCALFFSERFWSEHFGCAPPGLVGTGSGIPIGQYFLGPAIRPDGGLVGFGWGSTYVQAPTSIAYTRKDFYGRWDYEPER